MHALTTAPLVTTRIDEIVAGDIGVFDALQGAERVASTEVIHTLPSGATVRRLGVGRPGRCPRKILRGGYERVVIVRQERRGSISERALILDDLREMAAVAERSTARV